MKRGGRAGTEGRVNSGRSAKSSVETRRKGPSLTVWLGR